MDLPGPDYHVKEGRHYLLLGPCCIWRPRLQSDWSVAPSYRCVSPPGYRCVLFLQRKLFERWWVLTDILYTHTHKIYLRRSRHIDPKLIKVEKVKVFKENLSQFLDFYNLDGTLRITEGIQHNCTTKSATWFLHKSGVRQQACPRQLLFEDNFDNLDDENWNLERRFAGPPVRMAWSSLGNILQLIITYRRSVSYYAIFLHWQNYEFVVYMTADTTDVSDGRLRIKPILTNDKFGNNFVTQGDLILQK